MRFLVSIWTVLWLAQGMSAAWAGMSCAGTLSMESCCCAAEPVMEVSPSCCPEEDPAPVEIVSVSSCDCQITAPESSPVEVPLAVREVRNDTAPVSMPTIGFAGEQFGQMDSRLAVFLRPPGRPAPRVRLPILFCSFRC